MRHISEAEVEKVAELARLDLTAGEKSVFGPQLSQIVEYVGQLQAVSTAGVPPTSSVAETQLVLREDTVSQGVSVEEALANAPEASQGFFVVPKIIEK